MNSIDQLLIPIIGRLLWTRAVLTLVTVGSIVGLLWHGQVGFLIKTYLTVFVLGSPVVSLMLLVPAATCAPLFLLATKKQSRLMMALVAAISNLATYVIILVSGYGILRIVAFWRPEAPIGLIFAFACGLLGAFWNGRATDEQEFLAHYCSLCLNGALLILLVSRFVLGISAGIGLALFLGVMGLAYIAQVLIATMAVATTNLDEAALHPDRSDLLTTSPDSECDHDVESNSRQESKAVVLNLERASCPYCACPVGATEIVVCPRCQAPHHAACWKENTNACCMYGCSATATISHSSVPTAIDSSSSREYSMHKSYMAGELVYHPVWKSTGKVLQVRTTANGTHAIRVDFGSLGVRQLVHRLTDCPPVDWTSN